MYELGLGPDECVDAVSGRHGPNPDLLVLAGFGWHCFCKAQTHKGLLVDLKQVDRVV